jgi:hypothetical protein
MLLRYYLSDFEVIPVAPIIIGIIFAFTFHMRRISIVKLFTYTHTQTHTHTHIYKYIYVYIYTIYKILLIYLCCALVGLYDKLYKMHGTYIKIQGVQLKSGPILI